MFFTDEELDNHIRRRPSVQVLCVGAYLQQPMYLTSDVLGVPLSALGCGDLAQLLGEYISGDLDIHITVKEVDELKKQWNNTYPAVALIWHPVHDADTEELEKSADRSFSRAKRSLSLITGDKIDTVGTIVLHESENENKYNLSPQRSRNRRRMWFSKNEAVNFQEQVVNLADKSEKDRRLSLALHMFLDASNERSEEFRIVKLFNVIECLSAQVKGTDKNGKLVGSRDAARNMLKVKPGQNWTVAFRGNNISYDLIAVAGKFRDVLMHGSRVDKNTFAKKDRGIIDVLAYEPYKIADEIQRLVEDTFWKLAAVNNRNNRVRLDR